MPRQSHPPPSCQITHTKLQNLLLPFTQWYQLNDWMDLQAILLVTNQSHSQGPTLHWPRSRVYQPMKHSLGGLTGGGTECPSSS